MASKDMTQFEKHLEKMHELKRQIKSTHAGFHKNDLVRQYNRMAREYKEAMRWLNERRNNGKKQ